MTYLSFQFQFLVYFIIWGGSTMIQNGFSSSKSFEDMAKNLKV